ncbi:MAG: hypothetical protein ABI876_15135 [Bacteroidota bacterium]
MKEMLTLMTLALLLALPGCCPHGMDPDPDSAQPVAQKYLFEASSLNYAWGFAHGGLSIDSAGNLYSFQWEFRGAEWQSHANGEYTEAELTAEYAPSRKFIRTIPRDSLDRMTSLMKPALAGTYSDTTHTAADMGNQDMGFYRYDEARKIYTWTVLRRRGDFSFDNRAASAGVIADWLQALSREVTQ